ncbi:hypothetical protein AMTRI_Chr06g195960 [Amborella trichopoda]
MDMDDDYTQDENEAQDDEEIDGTMENNYLGDFGQGGTTGNLLDWRGGTTTALQTPPSFAQIFCLVNPDSETQQYHIPLGTLTTTSHC